MGSAIPRAITLRAASPEELESPPPLPLPPLLASVCDGSDAEDVGAADETTPFASVVVVCEEAPPDVEVVVAPVALATGTKTEPAVTVDVDVASGLPLHVNITAGMTKLPYRKQLFSRFDGSESGCAHAWSWYTCSVALPVEHAGRRCGTTPMAPVVTRQVSSGRETEGFTRLLSVHSKLRN